MFARVEGPEMVNATVPVYPPPGVTVTVEVPLLPCEMVALVAVIEKDCATAATVSLKVPVDAAFVLSPE